MLYLIITILVISAFTALICRFSFRKDGEQPAVQASDGCATCTGADPKCEQECMMEAAVQGIKYYEDEELDIYRDRPSDQYTETETEEFAEVLHTMRQDEVAGWLRSLNLRGINLPDPLKDEAFMLAGE